MIIYFGFFIGIFNMLVLFPRYIPVEYMGLTKVIQDFSILLVAFASLGFTGPFFRFNPHYQKYSMAGRNDLLQLYLIVVHIGIALVVTVCFFLKDTITGYFIVKSPLFSTYYYNALIFAYLLLIFNVMELYLNARGESVIQTFSRELVLRILILLLILAVLFGLPIPYFVHLFSIHYIIPVLILMWYIKSKYPSPIGLKFSKTTRRLSPYILNMAGFGIFQYVVGASVPVIDTLIVGGMVGLDGVANYLISGYIATLVHVPVRATAGLLGARIADFWKDNKIDRIQEMYQRTSMSYLIFSVFIVTIIILNINLFQYVIGANLKISLAVVGCLVGAKIFEMSTGLSNLILSYSKKWRLDTLLSIVSIAVSIALNVHFVGKWGIFGAAFSTLILAILTFSLRIGLLFFIYKLFPFKRDIVLFVFFSVLLSGIFYWLGLQTDSFWIKISLTFIYSVMYLVFVISLNFSKDINIVFNEILKRLSNK